MKIKCLVLIVSILFIKSPSFSDGDFIWTQVSGKWDIDLSSNTLIDTKNNTYQYGYSDLINNNTLISFRPIDKFTDFSSDIIVSEPVDECHASVLFSITDHYRSFYGIRLFGNTESINKLSLIKSDTNDSSLASSVKNNFTIKEIQSVSIKLSYNSPIKINIALKRGRIIIKLNDKLALEYSAESFTPGSGQIGFSHRNNFIRVKSVVVTINKNILFTDDFSKNRIKKYSYTAKPVAN